MLTLTNKSLLLYSPVAMTAPESAFAEVIDELRIDGFCLEESVLVYRPSRTWVVAELVHNVGRPSHWWTKFYTQSMGFYDRVAP